MSTAWMSRARSCSRLSRNIATLAAKVTDAELANRARSQHSGIAITSSEADVNGTLRWRDAVQQV
jgi:hypothetical protein